MVQFNLEVPPSEYVGTWQEGADLLALLMKKVEDDPDHFIGLDTETYGKKIPLKAKKDGEASKSDPLDWMQDTVNYWSLAANIDGQERRWCLPPTLLFQFIPLLENPKALFATWNGKYDAHVLYNSGIYCFASRYVDGLAMANLVDENLQGGLGLKSVVPAVNPFFHPKRRFDEDRYWEDLVEAGEIDEWIPIPMTKFTDLFPKEDEMGRKIKEYEYDLYQLFERWPDKVADYASLDAHATRLICEHLRRVMRVLDIVTGPDEPNSDMWQYFTEVEMPITEILWRMERRGLGIDTEYLESLIDPMDSELLAIEKELFQVAGWPVNIQSTAELTQLFFGEPDGKIKRGKIELDAPGLGLHPLKMTKGGSTSLPKPSTDKEVLEELAGMGIEAAKLVQRHRSVAKIKSTYVDAICRLCAHHLDGRIHPEFKQFGARTGRFSTKTPNSQNFPRPDGDEFHIRSAFIAPEGKKLLVCDYGQLEMRIMAHFSGDEVMIAAIEQGLDLHCVTVERMYGIPYAEVAAAKKAEHPNERQKELLRLRQAAKTIGFGIIYGAGAKTIGLQLEIPKEEAQEKIDLYFEAFPGVKDFMDETIAYCQYTEYVTTLVGRRRRLPDINHHQFIKRTHAERESINAPIQGSAADITKVSMINIEFDPICQELGVIIINQIHDEIVMEVPEQNAQLALERVQYLMEYPFHGKQALCVPTPTDAKIVDSWDQAK